MAGQHAQPALAERGNHTPICRSANSSSDMSQSGLSRSVAPDAEAAMVNPDTPLAAQRSIPNEIGGEGAYQGASPRAGHRS